MGVIKRIDKDVEVKIANATRGGFYYMSQKNDFIIDFTEFGNEDYVTYEELRNMNNRTKYLKNLSLVIVEVLDDSVSIEDIVKSLKIEDAYNELVSLGDEKLKDVDYINMEIFEEFLKDSDVKEVEKILSNDKSKVRYALQETASYMRREGDLSDYNKMTVIANKSGFKDSGRFWADVESAKL